MPSPLSPVLLIDDNPDDLFVLRQRLLRGGVKNPIVSFEDGNEAMAYLKRAMAEKNQPVPMVLFLDIRMPRRGGFEILKWVRAQPSLAEVNVVVVSSSALPEDAVRAKQLGASEFLAKFPGPEQLAEYVTDAGSRKANDEAGRHGAS